MPFIGPRRQPGRRLPWEVEAPISLTLPSSAGVYGLPWVTPPTVDHWMFRPPAQTARVSSVAPPANPPEPWEAETLEDGTIRMTHPEARGEEWRVGPNRLEIRRALFGFSRAATYEDATLELRILGGRFQLFVSTAGGWTSVREEPYEAGVRKLALFLSGQTGWPLTTRTGEW